MSKPTKVTVKPNASIQTHDPFVLSVMNATETTEMFGHDHLEEDGVCIPDELMERYLKNYKEFWAIQEELRVIKKAKDDRWPL